jgi:hypothetical protein
MMLCNQMASLALPSGRPLPAVEHPDVGQDGFAAETATSSRRHQGIVSSVVLDVYAHGRHPSAWSGQRPVERPDAEHWLQVEGKLPVAGFERT